MSFAKKAIISHIKTLVSAHTIYILDIKRYYVLCKYFRSKSINRL